jgi:L-arabinose isomerase
LTSSPRIPVKVIYKPVLTTPDAIRDLCHEANSSASCVGLITWMHTFSPAKKWIAGLGILKKPFLHLHTQFNRDIPWAEIDMDFINLNQSAHGAGDVGSAPQLKNRRYRIFTHRREHAVISLKKELRWNEVYYRLT